MGPIGVVATLSALASVRATVAEFATRNGAPIEFADDLILAVDEVCANIVSHGYADPDVEDAAFTLELSAHDEGIVVVVRDRGEAFDVQRAPATDLADWIARGKKGGLGIKLIKMLVDDVRYRRIDGINEVTLSKRLPGVFSS